MKINNGAYYSININDGKCKYLLFWFLSEKREC